MKRLLLISLALIALSACQNSPDSAPAPPQASVQTFSSDVLGLSLDYPNNWVIESDESEVQLATSAEILSGEPYTDGVRVSIFAAPSTAFDTDLISSLDQLVGFMTEDEDVTVEVEPELTTINGQEGATLRLAAIENEVPVFLSASIVRNEEQVAVILSLYDQANSDAHAQAISDIVNSVNVFAPTAQ